MGCSAMHFMFAQHANARDGQVSVGDVGCKQCDSIARHLLHLTLSLWHSERSNCHTGTDNK